MPTFIALLRGINVSGKNSIKMDALKKLFEELGFTDVRTYIQSGNVVFDTKLTDGKNISERIQNQMVTSFDLKIKLQILKVGELEDALLNNPFLKEESWDVKQHYFVFLDQIPQPELLENFIRMEFNGDLMNYSKQTIFIYYKNGAGNSKLTTNLIENKLKVGATMRNLNTVKKLIEMVG